MSPDAKEKKEGGGLVTLSERSRDLSKEICDILEARFGASCQQPSTPKEPPRTQNPIEQTHANMEQIIGNLEHIKQMIIMEIIEKL